MQRYLRLAAVGHVWLGCTLLAFAGGTSWAQPVRLDVHTTNGTDTSYYGIPLEINFHLDASGVNEILAIYIPLELHFTNGNVIGPLVNGQQFEYLPAAMEAFENLAFNPFSGATDPDTFLIGANNFAHSGWVGAADLCRIVVQPLDTTHITFSDIILETDLGTLELAVVGLVSGEIASYPMAWNSPTIVVEACPAEIMGDVNQDNRVTVGDIIYLVNYVFKSGPAPLPVALAGDADCSRRITSADMIWLAAYIFRGGAEPCPCSIPGS